MLASTLESMPSVALGLLFGNNLCNCLEIRSEQLEPWVGYSMGSCNPSPAVTSADLTNSSCLASTRNKLLPRAVQLALSWY